MNIKQHIKHGKYCPICGSKSLEHGFLDSNNNYLEQEYSCNSCGGRWTDIFKLSDVEDIELSTKYQVQYDDDIVEEYETMEEMKRDIIDQLSEGNMPFRVAAYNSETRYFDIEIGINWDLDFEYRG